MAKRIIKFPRPDDRNVYQPSGRVRWSVFLPGVLLTLVIAVLMAVALGFLGTWGWHIIIFAPVLLILPAVGALYGTVRFGHCRNPMLAIIIGVLVGLIVGVGHNQAELAIAYQDTETLVRVDELPEYVNLKMQHQVITEVGHDQPKNQKKPDIVGIIFNWFFLAFEVALCVGIAAAAGGLAAARVYDESRGRWAVPGKGEFHLSTASLLANALVNHSPQGIEEALAHTQFVKAEGYTSVEVYQTSLFNDRGDWEDCYFLTITQYNPKEKNGMQNHAVIVKGWQLLPDEAAILTRQVRPPAVAAPELNG
jgi:hypothetical protein